MEKFYYFAYASNLDVQTLMGRLKTDPIKLSLALLPHFGFRFNYPNPDGSARANIVPSKNESVYGILFEIEEADREYFLRSEPGYEFIAQEVFTPSGNFNAFTFISNKTKTGIFPLESYWKTIFKGGKENGLPNTYLSQILNRTGANPLMK
ncbi:gamma-glutamylcyclotransferase family protein [Cecembia sp.]|uniref:gamma-glutamylcyclotransferase family protein n=1 Tax=Cecembia sp. TaxID=1898110 RepID=UPI0025C3AB93|nr:gamma-glutamylcyclotransferase family protein [Cecembia sp.]